MTDAVLASDVIFKVGDGADPEVFTKLAAVTAITPPAYNADSLDATELDSPNATREFIQGLADPGEVTATMHWTVATDAAVRALQAAGTKNFEIEVLGTHKWSFAGFLTSFAPSLTVGEKIESELTIKVSGASTFGAVA